ncbi:pyridoxamine 5'-phosphate oxidase family protein [Chelatococcus daeguensis]|uniref:pyridoxamine 5'-phosphate oxidase family protein n=1 Tax=Chelatococcus daeguensis TaxID=444444 RepID=UPI0007ABA126|nr:pyridoxamine 5'-phosphate oxidase family protein [Chelatococcus daeguensis]KZE36577.1 pyridoxamine 5'-phosphate oxidase [Chelatococcus daeguensis]MBM3082180.1 pyridoxamine 5'-phosphate oxidase family protein [Chelatococcus daeguensis]
MKTIVTIAELEAIYGQPGETSTVKVTDYVTPHYAAFIEASPFVALATVGPEGLDCSPRGDGRGFVRLHDPHTLMLPDRHGNNRIDSLRNIVRDPRVALLFLIPGAGNTLRVNGHARLTVDETLRASFAVEGKQPRTVVVIEVREVYFQCARAIIRAGLWDPSRHVAPDALPTPGAILAALSQDRVGGDDYDKAWPERARQSMW